MKTRPGITNTASPVHDPNSQPSHITRQETREERRVGERERERVEGVEVERKRIRAKQFTCGAE